jgi:subtilisin
VTGADTVFDDIFRLLTPDRLLRDPRATGEGVSIALIDSGVEQSVLAGKYGGAIHPI